MHTISNMHYVGSNYRHTPRPRPPRDRLRLPRRYCLPRQHLALGAALVSVFVLFSAGMLWLALSAPPDSSCYTAKFVR